MTSGADASGVRLHKRVRPESGHADATAVWWSSKQQRIDREHNRLNTIANDGINDSRPSTASGEHSATNHSVTSEAADITTSSSHDAHSVTSALLQSLTTAASHFTWRLPPTQPLAASEQYLNDQLVHVMGAASAEMNATARRNGLTAQELEASEQEEAAICKLHLVERVWTVVASQTALTPAGHEKLQREKDAAEASVRNTLDLVSLLLYLRSQELRRETELSERLTLLERELQRTSHQNQTLALELDAVRERLAQQESQHRAKELAFATERKTLLVEKKGLDVMVARLQGVETAFKAQLRRKDAEYERLRKSLQDAVGRKEQRVRRAHHLILSVAPSHFTNELIVACHMSRASRVRSLSMARRSASGRCSRRSRTRATSRGRSSTHLSARKPSSCVRTARSRATTARCSVSWSSSRHSTAKLRTSSSPSAFCSAVSWCVRESREDSRLSRLRCV